MKKYLFVFLCFLGTFASIDAKTWYDYNDYGENGGYGGRGSNMEYRSHVAYGERFRYHSQIEYETNGGGGYYGVGHGVGGRDGYGGDHGNGGNNSGRQSYNYVPENCPGCNIKTFGVGRGMRNTFSLP